MWFVQVQMDWSPQFIFVLLLSFCRISTEERIITEREYDEEDWRPLRERPVVTRVVIPMPRIRSPPSSYSTRSDTYASKKRLQLEPSASNKVEVFAPAPPSILGSFSGFGHATVKAREPAHLKKKPVREQQSSETRPSYTALLLPPPVQDNSKILYNAFPQDERTAAAYYYEASLRPPPRDIIPPPHSSDLPPNSFYFDSPKTNGPRFQDAVNSFQSGFAPSSPGFRSPLTSSPSFESSYQFFNSDNIRSQTPVPRPGNVFYSRNPFGDITLSSRRPEIVKPVTEDKPPGKDVFHQLSHLGRPFQNPNLEYNNQKVRDPFLTTVSSSIQFNDDKNKKTKYSSGQPFQFTQNDFTPSYYPGTHSNYFATDSPFSFTTEVYPLTAKTVDIPSESDSKEKLETSTRSSSFISSHKPVSYHDTPVRTYQPHVEINSYQNIRNESPTFLPTPATNVEPYIKEPDHSEEQYNEVQTSLPPTQHHRFPPLKKPTEESYPENPSTLSHRFPPHQKPTEESNLENFSTVSSKKTHNTSKTRRRRPTRPTESSNTIGTEENQNTQDDESNDNNKETGFISTNIDYSPEDTPTTTERSHRRRKKPTRTRNREHSNFIRSSTTTSEPEPEKYISTQGFHYEFSTPAPAAVTDQPDYTVSQHSYVSPSQDPYINTESSDELPNSQTKNEYLQDTVIGIQNYFSTQPFDETQSSVEEEITEVVTTPTPVSSSVSTTFSTTTTTEAPSSLSSSPSTSSSISSYRTRVRNKYGNNTRPRFSVKEYKERINRISSTTPSTQQEDVIQENVPKVRYSTRTRGSFQKPSIPATAPEESLNESTTEIYRKYKPRVRYSYKSTTTTPAPAVQVDSPSTTTERSNTFRPSGSRYKPGTGKYYSRYRTSTESPATEQNETVASTTRAVRTKGVFSAKRRPYPLRTRPDESNKENEKELAEESKQYRQTVKTIENEIDPVTTVMTKKMDNAPTSTIMTSTNTEPVIIGPTGEDISTAQRIADLTSSPSNMYQSNGFRKGVAPSSRRTVPQITLATEDPILPLEAFFQSWSNNKDNNAR